MQALTLPPISDRYGLAPESSRVAPERIFSEGIANENPVFPLNVDGEIVLDFGRKLTGRIWIEADGPIDFVYGSDWEQLDYIKGMGDDRTTRYWLHETYERACPWGRVVPSFDEAQPCEKSISAFRLLSLESDRPVTIKKCWVDFSPPHLPLVGSFHCDDPELETMWHMGIYTTLACTQLNTHSQVPIPAPGKGYVIWDGPRRDREVWAGDLRLASLIWMSAYDDPEPIANSLYMLWQARHVGCDSDGLIPGAASSHQIFYEWTFWFLVNAWEYYQWTGDPVFLDSLMAANDLLFPSGVDQTLGWIERTKNDNGFVEATNSWMWSIKVQGEMASLAMVHVAGLEALAKLYQADGRAEMAVKTNNLAQETRKLIPPTFYDDGFGAYRLGNFSDRERKTYPQDANAWAILYDIGSDSSREGCHRFLDDPRLQSEAGLRCYWPPFTDEDGDWFLAEKTKWMHNETVWPYPNCYSAWAKFHSGRFDRAIEILKAFHRPHIERGYATLWEVMMPNGDTPISTYGNLGSLCHAWSGLATYLFPRYLLGVQPTAPGFAEASIHPNLGPLQRAEGSIPTPKGPIQVELMRKKNRIVGKATLPVGVEVGSVGDGIEICKRR